jgi:polynucleotide 5'-kinase involved in rRNA processing
MTMDSEEECPDLIDISNTNNSSGNGGGGNRAKVPVTIITGHLGSGKTTLLNYVLNEQHNKKVSIKY